MIRELLGRPGRSALILALALSASAALAQTPPATAPADPNAVVATVNGEKLTEREVQLALQELPQNSGSPEEQREEIIGFLINAKLVAKAARDAKMDQGADYDIKLEFGRQRVLMQTYLEKAAKEGVTEEAVKKVFDDTIKEMKPEEEIRARHILVETEEEAKKVADRIKAGEDFAAIAKEVSKDPGSGAEGGDLGYFAKGNMVPEFGEAAEKLEVGKVSDPVKSQYGWHIIKVEDKRTKPLPKFEDVRAQIEEYVSRRAQQEAVKKLLDAAKIERVGAPVKKLEETPAPAK
ncbi:peptidylprolyl isomerase [Terrihabitans soli]|uniref:Parvulin-like PPIase n=1 Tax=Terrihabitans soli TaxID=708113 RepID=A0A6S6QTE2_9HYPH|nr:peptidylprolyl isomerase [Terrihabitans soli]BCJ89718.1 peptidylprolyl isomerase [Terrihabitans soli]